MSIEQSVVLTTLHEKLTTFGIPCSIQNSQIRLDEWPTVAIFLNHIEDVTDPTLRSSAKILHLYLTFALNHERSDSAITSYVTGIGISEAKALSDAATQWCQSVVPPILSVFHQRPSYGAEWFAPDDPYGLTGWELFSSPYLIRGDTEAGSVMSHLDAHPLLPSLSEILLTEMTSSALFTTVSLYRGQVGEDIYADCFINGQYNERVTQALRNLPWPHINNFHSVRLFLFCMQDSRR